MRTFLQKWLRPPVFEGDKEKTQKARLINTILFAMFSSAFLYFVFAPIAYTMWVRRLIIIVPFLLVLVGLWGAMRRGWVRLAGEGIVLALWGVFTLAMGFGAGYNNPAYMGYVIVVVCAGLILGQRATIFWGGVSILTSLVVLLAVERGVLPESSEAPTKEVYWLAQTMYIVSVSVLLSLALGIIQAASVQAQQELADRMRAEEALRASEARLRMVLENLGEGVCVQDKDWFYTYANPSAHRILGWPDGELIGKNEDDVLPPSGIDIVKKENLARISGKITVYETDILRPNGEIRTVLATGVPRLDAQNQLIETFVAFTDITERKRLEAALQEERDFILQIIQKMGQGLVVLDELGRFILINPAYLRMTGYELDELLGKTLRDVMVYENQEIILHAWEDRKQGKTTTYENRLQHKDGHFVPVLVTGAPRWKEGQFAGAISVITDLTDIKQHEENLRATATMLKERNASLQIINEIAFKLHRSRNIKQIADEAVQALQAYSQSPMIAFYYLAPEEEAMKMLVQHGFDEASVQAGATLPIQGSLSGIAIQTREVAFSEDLWHDDRLFPAVREALIRQGLHSAVSVPLLFQNDIFGVINLVFREPYPLNASQREALTAIGNTIGLAIANANHLAQAQNETLERRRVEEEIRELNTVLEARVSERTAQLEEVNRELESFAYSVSHDLRTPLRAIEGFVTLLLEYKTPQLDEEGKHYLNRVHENSRRMSQLIEDLLTFSRLGRQPIRKQPVVPNRIIDEVLEELQPELSSRKVEFLIAPNLPICRADPALLRQVFSNLLHNALKYSRPRPVAIIEVGAEHQEETVYFVRDNGVGFDMHYAHKLFGVFQRLHRQDEFEGTGVGLANVQRIIHRHGGRIWFEAEVERGATFYFTLPG
ncbi:MAG: hypothetical protein Fur0022_14150 [Anaerolineales bacterium]